MSLQLALGACNCYQRDTCATEEMRCGVNYTGLYHIFSPTTHCREKHKVCATEETAPEAAWCSLGLVVNSLCGNDY